MGHFSFRILSFYCYFGLALAWDHYVSLSRIIDS